MPGSVDPRRFFFFNKDPNFATRSVRISRFPVTCADGRGAGVRFVKGFETFWDEKGLFGNCKLGEKMKNWGLLSVIAAFGVSYRVDFAFRVADLWHGGLWQEVGWI